MTNAATMAEQARPPNAERALKSMAILGEILVEIVVLARHWDKENVLAIFVLCALLMSILRVLLDPNVPVVPTMIVYGISVCFQSAIEETYGSLWLLFFAALLTAYHGHVYLKLFFVFAGAFLMLPLYLLKKLCGRDDAPRPPLRRMFSRLRQQVLDQPVVDPCSICTDPMVSGDTIRTLECGGRHQFHAECIDPWIARNPTCPNCRGPVMAEAVAAV